MRRSLRIKIGAAIFIFLFLASALAAIYLLYKP